MYTNVYICVQMYTSINLLILLLSYEPKSLLTPVSILVVVGQMSEPTQTQVPAREGVEVETPERTAKILREYYRRNIKYPGMTISLVFDAETGKRIKPKQSIRSKSGAHGEDVYVITKPVYIIRYERSNSGKARWSVRKITQEREEKVRFDNIPFYIQLSIFRHAEKEGIELRPWEEEGDNDD